MNKSRVNRLRSISISQSGPSPLFSSGKHSRLVRKDKELACSSGTRSAFKFPTHVALSRSTSKTPVELLLGRKERQLRSLLLQGEARSYVARCSYKTRTGTVRAQPKKTNQDAFLISPHLKGAKGQFLFGVFDGHGVHGHQVSHFIKNSLGSSVEGFLGASRTCGLETALKEGVLSTAASLRESNIETGFSGTTLSAVLIKGDVLVTANVGDSRAVMGKYVQGNWVAYELTTDHKPSVPEEKIRILKNNGRVRPLYNENHEPVGPPRVWVQDREFPGLSMSRSLGDNVAHSIGVTSDPELKSFAISKDDKFIVLASDGLWEFISSEEAVEIVGKSLEGQNSEKSCVTLVKEAVKRWEAKESTVDDITVIVVFFTK